jgi:hypothetical protein
LEDLDRQSRELWAAYQRLLQSTTEWDKDDGRWSQARENIRAFIEKPIQDVRDAIEQTRQDPTRGVDPIFRKLLQVELLVSTHKRKGQTLAKWIPVSGVLQAGREFRSAYKAAEAAKNA